MDRVKGSISSMVSRRRRSAAASARQLFPTFTSIATALRVKWSGRVDLNHRPLGPEPSALPGCATPRGARVIRDLPRRGQIAGRRETGIGKRTTSKSGAVSLFPFNVSRLLEPCPQTPVRVIEAENSRLSSGDLPADLRQHGGLDVRAREPGLDADRPRLDWQ